MNYIISTTLSITILAFSFFFPPHLVQHASISAQVLATNLLIVIGSLDSLLNAMSAVNWALYGVAFAGLIIMRITEPDRQRPFKVCPFMCVLW